MKRVALAIAVLLQACTCGPAQQAMKACQDGCAGCCTSSGRCEAGTVDAVCGTNGAACTACPDGGLCDRGTCAVPQNGMSFPCGNNTCPGESSDLCIGGQCTCGGSPLCTTGSRCVQGVCNCDPASCPGCCSGGTCLIGSAQSNVQCGGNGQICTDCASAADSCQGGSCRCGAEAACAPGRHCLAGQCDCDTATCTDGCCKQGQCVHFGTQSIAACGVGGHVCSSCVPGLADGCAGGDCLCGTHEQCLAGQVCRNGTCTCDSSSCPMGCCDGDACVPQAEEDVSRCGPPGGACIACPGVACLPLGCACQGHLACGALSVAAGVGHTCAVAASGVVRCWGTALDGGQELATPALASLPSLARTVASGDAFSCLTTTAGVQCFGPTLGGSFPMADPISAGARHVCGVRGGLLYCWGDDAFGQLGASRSDGGFSLVPLRSDVVDWGVAIVAAGARHTCAVGQAGEVTCWGELSSTPAFDAGIRALGSGDGVSCAAVPGSVVCWGQGAGVVGTFALDAMALGVGSGFACAVLSSGTVQCWGRNDKGQLGSVDGGPILALDAVTAVTTGTSHACALGPNQQVFCWGDGTGGKLGNAIYADGGQSWARVPVSD